MKFITNLKNNLARTTLTLLLAVLTTSAWAIQQDPDDGYYLIGSAQDWDDFSTGISGGTIAVNANARLTADNIAVSSMIGTENRKYAGTFEGNNYNIISAINATGRYVAPFSYVNGATIQNLTISGSVNGGIHCSGLIGCSNGTNTVSNVTINASITTSDSHCGGFIGHGFSSNVTFTNCVFAGEIHGRSANSLVGVFNGWSGNNISLNNCIEKGTYTNCNPFYPLGYGIGNVTNTYYLTAPSSGETKGTRAYSTMPEGEVCGQILAVDGNNYYVSTVISGINDRYELLGSSVTPEPVVTFLGNTLTKDADYTLSYNNNTSGGTGSVTITGTGSYSGAKTIEFLIAANTLSGSGTAESPFIIDSDADWTSFANSVTSGYTYTGLFVKMTNSVNAASMAGQREGEPFSGTFDGDGYTLTLAIVNTGTSSDINNSATGTAPFHYIKNATIKNVKTEGTVSATAIHASGLVGMADGTNTIQGCTVSATINTTSNYVGGILAHGITSNTTIRDCVFDGTINGRSGGSSYICGIYGWCHGGNPVITNCIEKGTYTNVGSYFNPIYMNNGSTTATISGTYYTNPKTNGGNDYGTQVYATVPEGEMCGKVTAVDGLQHYVVTTVSGINERYVLTGASVEPVPTVKFFNTTLVNGTDYTITYSNNTSGGTGSVIITGTETAYWGTKTVNFEIAANTLPGEGTVESPYTISDADDWGEFVNSVNNGFSYSGKIVQLMANININSSVGLREDFPFSGTFDGAGHTLTANISANGANSSGNVEGVAPFHFIKNATIKNLKIAGSITSTSNHAAGLVGFASGTNTIQSCLVSATLNVSTNYSGGIIGHSVTSTITVIDCLFDGTIARQTSSGNPAAGLWGWKDGGSAVITNCLENGTYTNCTNVDAIGWVPSITISNTYRINNSSRGILTTAEELSDGTTTAALQAGRTETVWVQDPVTNQPMLALFANMISFNGDGSEDNPFIITTTAELDYLASMVNSGENYDGMYFKLGADIAYDPNVLTIDNNGDGVNDSNYIPIGTGVYYYYNTPILCSFRGIFDGDGQTISGIRIYREGNTSDDCYQGVFGFIQDFGPGDSFYAGIYNLWVADVDITGWINIGGIVGDNFNCIIENCHVASNVVIRANNQDDVRQLGGIVGYNDTNSTVTRCSSAVTIIPGNNNSYYDFGGLAGYSGGTLTNNLVIGATIPAVNHPDHNNFYGAIAGSRKLNYSSLQHNYYSACTVAGVPNATNVGCGPLTSENNGVCSDLYDNNGAVPGYLHNVTGYGNSTESDHWAFIASPVTTVGGIAPTAIGNLITDPIAEYDLYRFNQSASKEWENYKNPTHTAGFVLENGKGYLYANKKDVILAFAGTINAGSSMEVNLDYDGNARLKGYNLVGNPFVEEATVNMPYYKMNAAGDDIEAVVEYATNPIPAFTGIIVEATGTGQQATFTKSGAKGAKSESRGNLQLTLSKAGTIHDKAIVSFSEGTQLGKYIFNENHAKLYIPQGSEDYAIVSVGRDGVHTVSTRMPINFRANENGQYIITVNPEGVEMAYLHLIDNMTGADVNLLQTPEYTFNAKVTDYESRFRLVFVCGDANDDNDTFAFISNGEIIVTGIDGNSVLQIIDLTGRVIASFNATNRIGTDGITAGVYVLRLIDGQKVRTQKIIVK